MSSVENYEFPTLPYCFCNCKLYLFEELMTLFVFFLFVLLALITFLFSYPV